MFILFLFPVGYTSLDNRRDTQVMFRSQADNTLPPLSLPDPDSVDLYICIRDDQDSERGDNLHQGGNPSGGSRLSLNSLLHTTSPHKMDNEQTFLTNTSAACASIADATLPKTLNDSKPLNIQEDNMSTSSESSTRSGDRMVELVVDSCMSNVRGVEGVRKAENGNPACRKEFQRNSVEENESRL